MKEVFVGLDSVEVNITNEDIVSVDECKSNSLVVFDENEKIFYKIQI